MSAGDLGRMLRFPEQYETCELKHAVEHLDDKAYGSFRAFKVLAYTQAAETLRAELARRRGKA